MYLLFLGRVDKNGFIFLHDKDHKQYLFNLISKKKFPITFPLDFHYSKAEDRLNDPEMLYMPNSLCPFQDSKNFLYGFKNITGKIVITPQFDDANFFSEGVALVSKKNQFGELKWGFIDTVGKTVIPFEFTNPPRNFYKNRAYVTPKELSEFFCGYIDKKGDLKIKLKEYPRIKDFKQEFVTINYRNSNSTNFLIDTNGVQSALPKKVTYANRQYTFGIIPDVVNGQIMTSNGGTNTNTAQGILNTKGEIIVPPVFYGLSFFDPTSKLAKAKFRKQDGKYIEGYINEDGIFLIIKAAASKW